MHLHYILLLTTHAMELNRCY